MTRHESADLIIAWANGEVIEYKSQIDNEWRPSIECPVLKYWEYRIKPKMTYRTGQRINIISIKTEEYLIASHGHGLIALTELSSGLRWSEPVRVDNVGSITEKEMMYITSNYEFKLVR